MGQILPMNSGGTNNEILLWENPNPSSSIGDVTFDFDFAEYKFAKILYKFNVNTSDEEYDAIYINSDNLAHPSYYSLIFVAQGYGTWKRQAYGNLANNTFELKDGAGSFYAVPLALYGVKR